MLSGMIHFMSVVILDLLQPPTLDQMLDVMSIMALLSMGSTLIVTFCINVILKR